jgi:hypothetical protein
MDKQSILGFVLIFLILMVWMWANAPTPKPVTAGSDSTGTVIDTVRKEPPPPVVKPVVRDSAKTELKDPFGKYFDVSAKGKNRTIVVETDRERSSENGN